MSILPILKGSLVLRKLFRGGFKILYTKGSHYVLRHPLTKKVTQIPLHGSRDIDRSLLSKIIKQAGLTLKEFLDL